MKKLLVLLTAALLVLPAVTSCSGGGGGNHRNPAAGSGGAQPWAIDDTAISGNGVDLLQGGDMFIGEMDGPAAVALGDQIWATLTSIQTWTAANPLYTYRFYDDTDPFTNWGRAFRYTGFNVEVGPIIGPPGFYGTGTYVDPLGQSYPAVILRTWDLTYWELLVIQSPTSIVHAIQHTSGLPIAQTYFAP